MNLAFLPLIFMSLSAAAGQLELTSAITKKLLGDQDSRSPLSSTGGLTSESIDNSIDPDTYLVGGGDAFQIAIVGLPSQEYVGTLNSDGNMYIAEFGEIVLGKITLNQAIAKIRDAFRLSLKNRYKVYVALKRAKRPVITVMGSVWGPGTYHMEGTQRLLDAIKIANQGQLPLFSETNFREVMCYNRDSSKSYDILKYLAGRDPSQNPYLYPGDRIEIRGLDVSVYVGGPISGPVVGRIPLIAGESAENILSLLTLKGSADTSYFLYRKSDQAAIKVPKNRAASILLADNDVITIPSRENFGTQDTVTVSGEVLRPGTYPIIWGKTTAAELLDLAGGATAGASMERAFVIRTNKIISPVASYIPPKSPNSTLASRLTFSSSQMVRPEINSSLNDMVAFGDQAVIRLSGSLGRNVPLENGDEVHVPRKESFVYVSGFVKNPGGYPYSPGKDISFYINLAKGYSPKADKFNRVVMTHYKGITQFKDDKVIDEGDVILIPAAVENKRFSSVYLPVIQTMATILSLAITIVAINQSK
jgi:protein involved in polysaccharide export with SLBB domain